MVRFLAKVILGYPNDSPQSEHFRANGKAKFARVETIRYISMVIEL